MTHRLEMPCCYTKSSLTREYFIVVKGDTNIECQIWNGIIIYFVVMNMNVEFAEEKRCNKYEQRLIFYGAFGFRNASKGGKGGSRMDPSRKKTKQLQIGFHPRMECILDRTHPHPRPTRPSGRCAARGRILEQKT